MILQKDKRFKNKWIVEEGCATMCVFYIVNKLKNYPFDIKEIERIVKTFKKKGIYTKSMDIIWLEAFKWFGITAEYKKVSVPYTAREDEYEITAYYNKRTNYTHFVVTHGDAVLYDPLGLSVTVAEGKQKSKRIFKIT